MNIEPALQPRNKSHLIMVNNSFNVLLDPVCYYLENFYIHLHQGNQSVVLLLSEIFGFGIKVMLFDQMASVICCLLPGLEV